MWIDHQSVFWSDELTETKWKQFGHDIDGEAQLVDDLAIPSPYQQTGDELPLVPILMMPICWSRTVSGSDLKSTKTSQRTIVGQITKPSRNSSRNIYSISSTNKHNRLGNLSQRQKVRKYLVTSMIIAF
jgi:hypothetical protein